ncbi:hypothetical protein ACQPW3_18880 [Actinosynnema sp. CA-248983]
MSPDHVFAPAPPSPPTSASGRPHRSRVARGSFAASRTAADEAEAAQRTRAALTVAGHSLDPGDCVELLSMLGLPDPETRFRASARDRHANRSPLDVPGTSHTAQGARL